MPVPERILNDPRLVTAELGGREWQFFIHRSGWRYAKNHGFTLDDLRALDESSEMDAMEAVLRMLWVAHLPFSPEMSFDEFDLSFVTEDYEDVVAAYNAVVEQQLPGADESKKPGPGKGKG